MAWSLLPNVRFIRHGEFLWRMKEYLVANGWSVARSGDGSGGNYSPSGDVHAPGGPYAGSLDLANAWMELRQPATAAVRRSILITHPSASNAERIRLWYSSDGTGFAGGSPSATARGTAADEQGCISTPSGTDTVIQGEFMDMLVGDVAEEHSFFVGARRLYPQTGSPGYDLIICLDVLTGAHSLDADPAVIGQHFNSSPLGPSGNASAMHYQTTPTQSGPCIQGWYKKGLTGAAFVGYPCVNRGTQEGGFNSIPPMSDDRLSLRPDGPIDDMPVMYWRGGSTHATERGYKGVSRLFRTSLQKLGIMRLNNDLTRLSLGPISIPWDGATRPIF